MISSVQFENFKCFRALRLEYRPLTLLTGINGGGKSTALQPLLLAAQGLRTQGVQWPLNGAFVRLGACGDVLPSEAKDLTINVVISTTGTSGSKFERSLRAGDGNTLREIRRRTDSTRKNVSDAGVVKILKSLIVLSPWRQVNTDHFPERALSVSRGDVGEDGRYAPSIFAAHEEYEVDPKRAHPLTPNGSLRKTLNAYLNDLFPGAEADVEAIPEISALRLGFRLSTSSKFVRPANMGYGLSYVFPILIALLCADMGGVVVIDSPEAHLHPSAQSRIGQIIARFAAAGLQIVVETHSDHLLNGVRLAIKNDILSHEDVSVHFFSGVTQENTGVSTIRVDKAGALERWPVGFFDQAEKDLSMLLDW
jgi:predicted ATPase